jgi:hypothetical protein
MADNTKEIAELDARARTLRSEMNRRLTNELSELQVQEGSLRRQVAVAKKGMEDANRALEQAHTEAADMEKWATELDKSVESNKLSNPKKAAEDRETAEHARATAVRAEQQARVARAEADQYRAQHDDLTGRHDAAWHKAEDVQSRLGRAESLGIDPIEEKARLLRESDRLEKSAADLEQNIGIQRDRNVAAKVIKESEASLVKMRAEAAKAEADAAKVKINEEIITESGLEVPAVAPPTPVATAEAGDAAPADPASEAVAVASLLDDEAGLVASAASADGDAAPASGGDDIVGDASVDDAASAPAVEPVASTAPDDAPVDDQAAAVPDLGIDAAPPSGVPIPFPNQADTPAEMADASAVLAEPDLGASLGGSDDLDGSDAPDPAADPGLDTLEA